MPGPLFAFLLAETAKVISVAAAKNEIKARASGLRGLSRDKERFILFPAVDGRNLLVGNCGKNRFMALSLLVTARVTEFLMNSGEQDYYRVDFGSIEIVLIGVV